MYLNKINKQRQTWNWWNYIHKNIYKRSWCCLHILCHILVKLRFNILPKFFRGQLSREKLSRGGGNYPGGVIVLFLFYDPYKFQKILNNNVIDRKKWFMVKPHTSATRMTYEDIRVTYGWHMSTYEWHTNDIRVHTSDIRMIYKYIRVTYGWHTRTYKWHTVDIRVHTSDIRMTYEYIRVTYEWYDIRMTFEWHTDDMQFERKIKLSFLKLFDNALSKYLICKRIPCMQWLFWDI